MLMEEKNKVNDERRKYPRKKISCTLSSSEYSPLLSNRCLVEGYLINISLGGALIETAIKFSVGTPLLLDINLTGWKVFYGLNPRVGHTSKSKDALHVNGKVVRVIEKNSSRHQSGAEFLYNSEDDKALLAEYLSVHKTIALNEEEQSKR